MSIQNTTVKNVYVGNGSTTVFPYTFEIKAEDVAHISVFVTGMGTSAETETEVTNFTVDASAKTVTYPNDGTEVLPDGAKIAIIREMPYTQDLNLENQGPFFSESIETQMDKMVMQVQQLNEKAERAVTVPATSSTTPAELITELQEAAAEAVESAAAAKVSETNAGKSATEAAETVEAGKTAISTLVTDGTASLTQTINDGTTTLGNTITSGVTTINTTRDAAVNTVNDAKTAALTEINPKVQEAANSASAAAKSASAAATSEANAGKSESNAKASETNAATSEANAKTSETNAANSETNAKTSETNAGKSETNAAASESAAAGSASSAAGSATAAATSATNAKTSETNSATSEKKAGEYAEKAESYYDITYHVKGDVSTYADLPTNPENGDVYKILTADSEHGVRAGDKVAWVTSSNSWENFAGSVDLSGYVPIAEESSITFSLGYDENGAFMVTPD